MIHKTKQNKISESEQPQFLASISPNCLVWFAWNFPEKFYPELKSYMRNFTFILMILKRSRYFKIRLTSFNSNEREMSTLLLSRSGGSYNGKCWATLITGGTISPPYNIAVTEILWLELVEYFSNKIKFHLEMWIHQVQNVLPKTFTMCTRVNLVTCEKCK